MAFSDGRGHTVRLSFADEQYSPSKKENATHGQVCGRGLVENAVFR
jgi:hypothetical protein